jgi:hypothetical protein
MKNLLAKILLVALGFTNLTMASEAQADLLKGEVSIRPLQPGLKTKIGVLGVEVGLELNGRKTVEEAVYITGAAAKSVITTSNTILKTTRGALLYSFDESTQMIVITGQLAKSLISEYGHKALAAGVYAFDASVGLGRAMVYETQSLARAAANYAMLSLCEAARVLVTGAKAVYAGVKYVVIETAETAKDAGIIVAMALRRALDQSVAVAVDIKNTAEAYAGAGVIFLNDAGLFVYDHTKEALFKIGAYTAQGVLVLTVEAYIITKEVSLALGAAVLNGIETVLKNLYVK